MIYMGGAPGGPFENPYWYRDDPDYCVEIADLAVHFFETYLTHTKGSQFAGKSFKLFPWQKHRIIRPLFGILKEKPVEFGGDSKYPNGLRRFRRAYFEIPKKNGKSELVSGIGLWGLLTDNEDAAEIFTAASDKEQATIIHKASTQMVRNNDFLFSLCGSGIIRSQKRIIYKNSYYQALSADVPTKHGFSPHMVLFDELHAQPNSDLWDVLTEGSTKARIQPLILSITTAGYDQESICYKQREYAVKVLTGVIEDKEFLPVIYGMDSDDEWEDERNWKLVNPSLYWETSENGKKYYQIAWDDTKYESTEDVPGIFPLDDFRKGYELAKEMPYKINLWRRLQLNQWTNQEIQIIDMNEWRDCGTAFNSASLYGQICYPGLDLSLTTDLTAFAKLFPQEDNYVKVLWNFWMPQDNVHRACERDGVPYDEWIREGYINATPGNVIDYEFIKAHILKDRDRYEMREFGYDPYHATQIALQLQAEGIIVVPVRQTFKSMNEPTKEFLDLIKTGKFDHGNNPVVRWMASNFTVIVDNNENIRPFKAKQTKRIDGIVAAIIGLSGMILHYDGELSGLYEEAGPMVL